jgi:hypothetical protein
MTEVYWISKTVVVDWPLVDLDGAPVTDATVVGTVTLPDETTAPMNVTVVGDLYRATYDSTIPGQHAYRLEATGTIDTADEGTFYVKPSLVGIPPPTVDPTTDIGKVRLLCSDVDEDNLLFTDAQITAFLEMEDGLKRAAAQALEVIASSEVLISKVIRTQDLSTDGSRVSAELRALAKSYRDRADIDDDEDGGLDVVDFVDPRFERLLAWPL